jgi:hypothetical protein
MAKKDTISPRSVRFVALFAAVAGVDRALGLGIGWRGWLAGQAVSALTHYMADHRENGVMFRLADRLGKGRYLRNGGGAPLLDQTWHIGSLGLAALATAAPSAGKGAE